MMKLTSSFLLTSLLITFTLLNSPATAVQTWTPNAAVTDVNNYIKSCCAVTLYTDLCYNSLSAHFTGPNNLASLTTLAIKLSLTKATKVADYVVGMNRTTTGRASGPVQDCTKLTKSTVSEMKRSLEQMVSLVKVYGSSDGPRNATWRFGMSNVQTWMSAGITNQGTCVDGFKDVEVKDNDDYYVKVKKVVSGRVMGVKRYISNTLALVNSYVDASH